MCLRKVRRSLLGLGLHLYIFFWHAGRRGGGSCRRRCAGTAPTWSRRRRCRTRAARARTAAAGGAILQPRCAHICLVRCCVGACSLLMQAARGASACVPVVLCCIDLGLGMRCCSKDVSDLCQTNLFCDVHPRVLRARQVRVVCSSGGHFARQASGKEEYEGGETRLVSVANFCSLADLQEALERVAAARQGGGAWFRVSRFRRVVGGAQTSAAWPTCRRRLASGRRAAGRRCAPGRCGFWVFGFRRGVGGAKTSAAWPTCRRRSSVWLPRGRAAVRARALWILGFRVQTRGQGCLDFCSLADLQEALERVAAARQGGGARPGAVDFGF